MNPEMTAPIWPLLLTGLLAVIIMLFIAIDSYLHPDRWASSPKEKERAHGDDLYYEREQDRSDRF